MNTDFCSSHTQSRGTSSQTRLASGTRSTRAASTPETLSLIPFVRMGLDTNWIGTRKDILLWFYQIKRRWVTLEHAEAALMLNRCDETSPPTQSSGSVSSQRPDYESLLLLIIKLRNYKPAAAQSDLTLHINAPTLLKTIALHAC